jgi:hypothetical protein
MFSSISVEFRISFTIFYHKRHENSDSFKDQKRRPKGTEQKTLLKNKTIHLLFENKGATYKIQQLKMNVY